MVWPGPLRPDQTPGLSDVGFEPLWSQPGRAPCAYLRDRGLESVGLKRDDFSSNRPPALSFWLSMISGQTLRVCPEGKPASTPHQVPGRLFPDHALAARFKICTRDDFQRQENRCLYIRSGWRRCWRHVWQARDRHSDGCRAHLWLCIFMGSRLRTEPISWTARRPLRNNRRRAHSGSVRLKPPAREAVYWLARRCIVCDARALDLRRLAAR